MKERDCLSRRKPGGGAGDKTVALTFGRPVGGGLNSGARQRMVTGDRCFLTDERRLRGHND